MDNFERELRKMSVGDVIDYSIEIYKRNFKKLTALSLIFYIPFIFVYSIAISYLTADMDNIGINAGIAGVDSSNLPYMLLSYYLLLFGMLGFYLLYSLTLKTVMDACIAKIVYSDVVNNSRLELKKVIKESFKKFKTLFANRILYYLIMFGIGIGFYILLFIFVLLVILGAASSSFIMAGSDPLISILIVILVIILFLLMFIPLIAVMSYFYAKFGMGVQFIAIENKGATEAISRCNEISKKSFWSISMSVILGFILYLTIPSILSAGTQSLMHFNKTLFIAANTTSQTVWALLNPFVTTLLTVIFINQKIKNEGLDLEVKVDRMLMEVRNDETLTNDGDSTDDNL